jgi:hypothetical protein
MSFYDAALNALRVFTLMAGSLVIFLGIMQATREARGAGGRRSRSKSKHGALSHAQAPCES